MEQEEARGKRHAARMLKAQAHYEDCLRILAEYGSPGGGFHYKYRYEAEEARQRYKRAYATVWARTSKGRVNSRVQDGRKRLKGEKRIRNSRPDGTGDFYRRMLVLRHQICFYCYRPLSTEDAVGDHFIPLAKGGEHEAGNLVVACRECNSKKSDKLPSEFSLKVTGS